MKVTICLFSSRYTSDESLGGRYTGFMSNYRPQIFIRTADVTISLAFPEGTPDPNEKMVS